MSGIFALVLAAVGPALNGSTTIIDQASNPTFVRQVMRSYASCAVDSEHQLARKFVLMNPNEHLPDKEFQRVFPWQCLSPSLNAQLKMRPFQFRAAMAEVLIRLESRDRQKFNPATLPPLHWDSPKLQTVDTASGLPFTADEAVQAKAGFNGAVQDKLDGEVGECIVRANPSGALKVINTWSERAELSATKRLEPEITRCTQEHEGLKLSPYRLHDAIAFSYYRLANAADVSK